jgi:hypothetical protein
MKDRYVKGMHFTSRGDDFKTYEIDDVVEDHVGKIRVYKDIKLRNKIIALLNRDERLKDNKAKGYGI